VTEGDRAAVERTLAREYPDREVRDVSPVPRGNNKATAVATFADGERVVVQRSADREEFRTELALTRAIARRTDVPVPTVRASGDDESGAYAVLDYVAGADLHERFVDLSVGDRRAIARRFGEILATLQEAFDFEEFGAVTVADGDATENATLRATGGTDWPAWFEPYAREGIDALPNAFADLRDPLRAAVEDAALPESPPARLYPWDLRPGNALVEGGALAAVLDWGDPLSAAPGLAVAKAEHLVADWYVDDGAPLREAFREGYRGHRAIPEVPRVYRLVAMVRSAVDSRGVVTRPGYPERKSDAAVSFHRERIEALL
jgi:hypothetical protein